MSLLRSSKNCSGARTAFEGFSSPSGGDSSTLQVPGTDIHGDDADSLNLWIARIRRPDPIRAALLSGTRRRPVTGASTTTTRAESGSGSTSGHNAESTIIPYRENRAVLFEGHLFHRTDDFTLRARIR